LPSSLPLVTPVVRHHRFSRFFAAPRRRCVASTPEALEPRRLLAADPAVMLRSVIASTEIDAVGNPPVAAVVGELVTHRLTLEVPAGTLRDAVLDVTLDESLGYAQFVGAASSSPSLSVSGSLAPTAAPDGRSVAFALGTLDNADLDPATPETIEFTFRTVVRNVAAARAAAGAATTARFTQIGRAHV